MPHTLKCHVCSRELSVSDKLFDERISGKKVSIRCKHCNTQLIVTGDGQRVSTVSPDGTVKASSNAQDPSPHASATAATKPEVGPPVIPPAKPTLGLDRTLLANSATAAPHQNALAQANAAINRPPPKRTASASMQGAPARRTPPRPASPPSPSHPDLGDAIEEISSASLILEDPPSPVAAISPVPIVSLELTANAHAPEAPADPNMSPVSAIADSTAPPAPQDCDSGSELTPAAMTLKARAELAQLAPPGANDVPQAAVKPHNSWLSLPRGRVVALSGASAVLAVAAAFALVTFGKGPPSLGRKPMASADVIRTAAAPAATAMPTTAPPAAETVPVPTATAAGSIVPADGAHPQPDNGQGPGAALGSTSIPDSVARTTLTTLTTYAVRRAQRCHPSGHAVGTAIVFFTFAPNGSVTEAKIEGEPLASAPVARCILDHARSIRLPRFTGEPFTYSVPIAMR